MLREAFVNKYGHTPDGTHIALDSFSLRFPLELNAGGLSVCQDSDTLIAAGTLSARVSLLPLFVGKVDIPSAVATAARYRLGGPDSTMFMTIAADSISLSDAGVTLSDMDISLSDGIISGGRLAMTLNPDTASSPAQEQQKMRISVRRLRFDDFGYTMHMMPTIDTLSAVFADAELREGNIDLEAQTIAISAFTGSGLRAEYIVPDSASIAAAGPYPEAQQEVPAPQPWTVTLDSLAFDASSALYTTAGTVPAPGLDFAYISVDNLDLHVRDFLNRGTTVRVPMRLSARERCGLRLDVAGILDIDSAALTFRDFNLSTPENTRAAFHGVLGMGDMVSDTSLPLALSLESAFAAADLAAMFPLASPVLAGLPSGSPVELDVEARGTTGRLGIEKMHLQVNRCVSLNADGTVENCMNPEAIGGRIALRGNIINVDKLKNRFLDAATADQLNIPPMTLRGRVDMNSGTVSGNLAAVTRGGDIRLAGRWNSDARSYRASLDADRFPVQAFLPELGVGSVTATVSADGHGYDPFDASTEADVHATLAAADYRGATYSGIDAHAELHAGQAKLNINSTAPDADFTVDAAGNLDGDTYTWNATVDGRHIDLHALALSPEPCTVEANGAISATVNPSARRYGATLRLDEAYYRRLSGTIVLNDVDAVFSSADSLTTLRLDNRDLTATFDSPCGIDTLAERFANTSDILAGQMKSFFIDADTLARALPPFRLHLAGGRSNLINDILDASGMSIRNIELSAANDSNLCLNGYVYRLATESMTLDSIFINARGHDEHFHMLAGLRNRPGNMDQWHSVDLSGRLQGSTVDLGVKQQNLKGKTGFEFGLHAAADVADSTLVLNVRPYTPTIGYQKWSVNEDNYISYNMSDRKLDANLRMEGGNSSLAIFMEDAPESADSTSLTSSGRVLAVQLTDIHIQDWISFNPFAPPMSGDVSADLRLGRNDGRLVGTGSAGVMNLVYDRRKVADFKATFDVSASRGGELTADADLFVDGTRTVTVRGIINQADSTATSPLALDFSMIKFPLATANPFLPRSAGSLGGTLNGTLKISGSPDAPVFDGFLAFDQAAATVGMLGTTFTFSDRRIPVVNNMATLDTFAITGSNANPLTIDGSVDLSNLSDLGLDLRLEASDMMLVNSRKPSRDAVVYGKAYIDLDAKVRGSMASMLTVDADLALLPETNVTYVMETTSSELVNRSSGEMVKFVSFADSTAVAKADSIQPAGMLLLVDADLDIQTGSIINVDLDPQGNNKIQIESDGNLSFAMTPMNSGRLTGRLNIDKGFARYGMPPVLGEQTFRFVRGSYVAFSGDMMNPTLNIHATNTVKSNVTQEGQNSRLVNFDIGLSVTGTLERMDVAFDLSTRDDMTVANELESMSAEQRANQAINLMLYHTYTGGGTKGSGISNPLYSFLAGQLNNWAANTIKGVDISFGIDQYDRTVNGSTSQTTSYSYQVSKTLFNDRFKIVVGGNYSTDANADENFSQNLISDISYEYFLNSARSMYIRLFRHTGYESILEGEITQTGVGFVYRRKLSRLSDMFLPPRLVEKRHKRQQLDMDRQQAPAAKKSQQQ